MSFQFNGLKALAFTCILFSNHSLFFAAPTSVWLECPTSVTITCKDSYSDLDKWGKVWVWENYVKKQSLQPKEVLYNLNSCGIGKIIRKWEYEDKHWKWHTCTQEINIVSYGDPFSALDIIWPLNYEINGCNPSVDPKSLPKTYNYPTFKSKACSQPMYSYQDMKFNVTDGCMKVLRSWKVIDWCQYIPNSKSNIGLWTYTQVIKISIKDTLAKIVCPRDTTIMAFTECDSTFVKLDSAYGFSTCGNFSKITNNSPFSINKGPNASGKYPLGTTSFYFYGEYGCGQQISCKVTINVVNKIGPTPYCLNGLIVALMPVDADKDGIPEDGMIEVWANDVDHGSFSKCGNKNLKLSFSSDVNNRSRVFTCADLGKNEVEMWVTDQFGNKSFCKTYIEVQNNNAKIPNCKRDSFTGGNNSLLHIAGNIQAEDPSVMESATLTLIDMGSYTINERTEIAVIVTFDTIIKPSGTILYIEKRDTIVKKIIDSTQGKNLAVLSTALNSSYSFKNIPVNKNYKILPLSTTLGLQGINISDAIVLLRHTLGVQKITNPYKKIAADINNDGLITNSDFDLLYAVLNGRKSISEIPKLWRYLPQSYNALLYPAGLQEYNMYIPLQKEMNNEDFIAIKTGNLSAENNFNTTFSRSNLAATSNKNEVTKFMSTNIQLRFNSLHKALKYIENENFSFEINDPQIIVDKDRKLILSTKGEGISTLSISVFPNLNLNISDHAFQNFLNTLDGESISIHGVEDIWTATIYPNPISESDQLNIVYHNLSSQELEINLYNSEGKAILTRKLIVDMLKSRSQIELPIQLKRGFYFYRISQLNKEVSGKIIVN
ncbi:MAG: T9SS type A sorting domain-containing protein [Saprospiraceae bacterium]|nr:T9SS type A sorting domain-containing protein [Saprospiraceae bacterium]